MSKQLIIKATLFFSVSFVIILSLMTVILGLLHQQPKTASISIEKDSLAVSVHQDQKPDSTIPTVAKTDSLEDTTKTTEILYTADTSEAIQPPNDDSTEDSLPEIIPQAESVQDEDPLPQPDTLPSEPEKRRDTDNAKKIAQIYEKMGADEAAVLLGGLKEDLAVAIIASMRKRQAAKVLAAMEPNKAILISKKLADFN